MVKRRRLRDVLVELLVVFILGLSIFYLALAVLIPDSPTLPRLATLIVSLGVAAGIDRLVIAIYDRVRPVKEHETRPIGAGSEEAYLRGLLRDFEREQEFFVRLSGEVIPTRYDAFSGAYTHDRPGEPLKGYSDIRQAVRDHERFVIVGDPGAGKTTTMRRLAEAVVYARLNPAADPDPLVTGLYSREARFPRPLWVKLGDSDNPPDALDLLRHIWQRHNLPDNPEAALANNDVWLFLDGLNEMPERGKGRKERAASIKALLEDNPNIRAVVTCRTWDFDELSLSLDVVRVRPLDWPRVEKFAYKRLGDQAEKFINALEEAKPRLTGLADNPYYLVMLIEIFRPDVPLPDDLHALYQRYIRQCYDRDNKRGLMRLPLKRLERRLRRLAFRMIVRGGGTVADTGWARWRIGWKALCDGVNLGILVREEYGVVVRFYHQSLHEYFALPGLASALARQPLDRFRPDRRRNLIRRLGGLGKLAGPAMPGLLDALRDADADVRGAAAGALGEIGDAAAVPALLDTLSDADWTVRMFATWALRGIGDTAAVPGLLDALRDVDVRVLWAAAGALEEIGDAAAVPALLDTLSDADAEARQAAASVLGGIGGTIAVPGLIDALHDTYAEVRASAARALGRIGDSRAVPALIERLTDTEVTCIGMLSLWEERVCTEVARALGRIGDTAAVPGLLDALRDADARVRWTAARALGEIGDSRVVPALIERLADTEVTRTEMLSPDEPVCNEAARALVRIGDAAAVPGLLNALRDADTNVRWRATWALGEIGDAAAVPGLLDALHDTYAEVRVSAVWALGRIGDARAVPSLIERLTDTEKGFLSRVCDEAAEALEQIGTPEALAAVEEWRKQRGADSS